MQTRQELDSKGIPYKQCLWKWEKDDYIVETYEFSDELMEVDYSTYLGLWCNRLSGQGDKKYLVIKDENTHITNVGIDHWDITLVELGEANETEDTAL